MILIQQDNLFSNIQMVRAASLRVPLYTCAEYNQQFAREEDWPGQRSDLLSESAPELNDVIHRAVNSIPFFQQLKFHTFVHFRGADAEDWIHQDHEPLAGIIYINPTNVESGTRIYNQQQQIITDCKYVQNRLVMYSGGHLHQGYGHFGSDPIKGRTTINLFLDESQSGAR
jgi:hypothetical protein